MSNIFALIVIDDRAEIIGKKLCENLKLLENFADNVI